MGAFKYNGFSCVATNRLYERSGITPSRGKEGHKKNPELLSGLIPVLKKDPLFKTSKRQCQDRKNFYFPGAIMARNFFWQAKHCVSIFLMSFFPACGLKTGCSTAVCGGAGEKKAANLICRRAV
jgi:hypothetical protein